MSKETRFVFDKVLPFNPKTDVYESFSIDLTPEQAQYILDFHNKDNRKLSKSQVTRITRSIENDNWLLDGQPITFNVDGNLTEGQHRLSAIVKIRDENGGRVDLDRRATDRELKRTALMIVIDTNQADIVNELLNGGAAPAAAAAPAGGLSTAGIGSGWL